LRFCDTLRFIGATLLGTGLGAAGVDGSSSTLMGGGTGFVLLGLSIFSTRGTAAC
jgi:hypothetical protein